MNRTVVVVSYRPTEWLHRCLASVADQADQLVVVDNGSAGGEASDIGRQFGATVVALARNTGVAGGMNAGIAAATGDMVALLNDDAVADHGWLDAAAKVLDDPSVGAVTPKLLLAHPYAELRLDQTPTAAPGDPRPLGRMVTSATVGPIDVLPALLGRGIHEYEHDGPRRWRWTAGFGPIFVPIPEGYDASNIRIDGEPVDGQVRRMVDLVNSAGTYLSTDGSGGDHGYEAPDDGAFDAAADRFGACGAAFAARRETFAHIGSLATDFFAYYEDTDWCWRAQLAGLRIRYDPSATVRHLRWGTSGGPTAPLAALLAARNRILTLARNAPTPVFTEQLARAVGLNEPDGIRRSLARRLPKARAERILLRRRWTRSPEEVWQQWTGVDDRWPEG